MWNSLLVVDRVGAIVDHLRQRSTGAARHIPFRRQLAPVSGSDRSRIVRGGVSAGDARARWTATVLACDLLRGGFSGSRHWSGARPVWLRTSPTTLWFGVSSGPFQHLTSARLRSIEEGLPDDQGGQYGISAVMTSYGQVVASLGMQQEGVIDHKPPGARGVTPYGRWNDWTTPGSWPVSRQLVARSAEK